jgi:hypothetical protein
MINRNIALIYPVGSVQLALVDRSLYRFDNEYSYINKT